MKVEAKTYAAVYLSVFLLSVAMLSYEVTLTRWLAISQWSHFAYLVVSIALLGLAAAGTAVAVSRRIKNLRSLTVILWSSLAAAALIPLAYFLTRLLPFDEIRLAWDRWQWVYIGLYYIWLGLPFFATGVALAHVFTRHSEYAGRIYFFNLVGSAVGSLGILFLLNQYPPNQTLKWIVIIYIAAAQASLLKVRARWSPIPAALILILFFIPAHLIIPPIQMSPYKALPTALQFPESKHILSISHSLGQLDVVASATARFAPGLSLSSEHEIPQQLGLTTDGDGMNAITRFDGDRDKLKFIEDLPTSWVFQVDGIESALVIEPGGGLDVLTAVYFGAQSIDAVESHPQLKWVVDEELGDFSGWIYSQPLVLLHPRNPRFFLETSRKQWNTIILSLAGSPGAASTGMYGLTENYLYTKEAFHEYLRHLSDNGWLSITRYLLPPPREGVRIVSLAAEVLREGGVESPGDHIIVFRTWGTVTIGVKRSPVDPIEIERLRKFLDENQFDWVYYPGMTEAEANQYNKFEEPFYYRLINRLLTAEDPEKFYEENIFNLRPVSDERPFFFSFFPLKNIRQIYHTVHEKWQALLEGGYLIYAVLVQAMVISFILVIFPLFITRRRDLKRPTWLKGVVYFTMIGLAYMLVELVFIQYGIRFLGSATYAVALVVAVLLLSSGVGSLVSQNFYSRGAYTAIIILLIISLIGASQLIVPYIILCNRVGGLPAVILFLTILPFGILMGIPFPTGVRWLGRTEAAVIPWGFAFNGAASVIGAVLAIVLALGMGFSNVLLVAAGLYFFAGLLIWRSLR